MQTLIIFIILGITFVLFVWGKLRYDLIALLSLFLVVLSGIIPFGEAFSGFGHPAVITVAAVMIISKGLQNSGLIDLLARWLMKLGKRFLLQIVLLSLITAVASSFMNNVGALAIMMPVAIHLARKSNYPPSYILMPLSFSSLLGGMMTLIGTPPNIIIAAFRHDVTGSSFRFFDFAPVGFSIMIVGILFISFIGWRLIPKRKSQNSETELFKIDDYMTEVKVIKEAKFWGKTIAEIDEIKDIDIKILGLIRDKRHVHIPDQEEKFKVNDVLILEADSDNLKSFLDITGFSLVGGKQFRKDAIGAKDITIREAVVMDSSKLIGNTAAGINMRSRFGINLLAIARRNRKITQRIDKIKFKPGDVLLLQGRSHKLTDTINNMGCLPLAERGLRIGYEKRIALTLLLFIAAIFLVANGVLPVQIAFTMTAFLLVVTKIISLRDIYDNIEWSVIILLGAMLPVGMALEVSGGADLIASWLLNIGTGLPAWMIITVLMVITMFLSDIINNAATVVLMAPIAINLAQGLNASVDPFLMAVAISGSCAFLTPIGHQSNTIVMGPGGYKFGDYWKMGLPLEILVIIIGIPLILHFWPL